MLQDKIPLILSYIEDNRKAIEHNRELFTIFEGDLLTSVEKELKKQLNTKSFEAMKGRIAPINILKRIIQKLSKLYSDSVIRRVENTTDQELIEYYENETSLNSYLGDANEFFNLFKNTAIEPFISGGKPQIRIIPSHQFLVWSDDSVNPLNTTLFIKFMGKTTKQVGPKELKQVDFYFLYTDDEFLAIDQDGDLVKEYMKENPDGVNPFGKIPFIYVNRSRHNLIPLSDTDTLRMTVWFPILISDLAFASMFLSHSVFYGIDLDFENLEYSPNAFWSFSSDPEGGTKPEIGVVKPEVDTDKVLNFIRTTLAFWLESRNLKPGSSVNNLSKENLASGISQIIQNLDTTEDRKQQVTYFKEAENSLWDLISKYLHPVWVKQGMIEERRVFSNDFTISVEFSEQKPLVTDSEKRANIEKELSLGLTTKRRAIKSLYPHLTDEEIETILEEINEEKKSKALNESTESQNTDKQEV